MRAPGRPWTRLASTALAGHVFFELGAGVGMPFASVLGPVPAAACWAAGTLQVQRAARSPGLDGSARRRQRAEPGGRRRSPGGLAARAHPMGAAVADRLRGT